MTAFSAWLLLIHLAATLFMTGLIWVMQVVHYPLFAHVGESHSINYQLAHMRSITWLVLPVMATEFVTGMGLLAWRPSETPLPAVLAGLVLLSVIWISTALVQSSQHAMLALAFDASVHHALVAGNWLRTVGWSLRSLLVLWITYCQLA